ncbi:hypothetical protein COCC4DRAFT_31186 [Bipolaris maydis ATCC 48331]|uniref:Uncharacterized protein n=2 Tax=Cochliobolus heterostrophus TaxID=5016 RepID=M2U4F6_COCH5|nr:uncharacterized protein COCC4DRAFT_31186 [Bipolaris maydis ATCC 48331]EMD93439.1 hypothetical protein COCHEDRAFT_1020517 [Bipolaris maydis C5]ENI07112.1 hypothetical protein COCC4DRAFT_31186 [Bipolaris maydis ATCC 48331]
MIIEYFSNNERYKILRKPPSTAASMFPTSKRLEEPKLSDTNDPNDYEPVYICSYGMKCYDDPVFFSQLETTTLLASRFLLICFKTGSVLLPYALAGSEITTCVCIDAYALAVRQTISSLPGEPHEPFSARSTPFVSFP